MDFILTGGYYEYIFNSFCPICAGTDSNHPDPPQDKQIRKQMMFFDFCLPRTHAIVKLSLYVLRHRGIRGRNNKKEE